MVEIYKGGTTIRKEKVKTSRKRIASRPTKTVSYNLPKDVQSLLPPAQPHDTQPIASHRGGKGKGVTSPQHTTSQSVVAASRIQVLLDLIHRRNKNQHRNQPFFKHINFLRRAIKHLTSLHQQYLRLEDSTHVNTKRSTTSSKTASSAPTNAEKARRRFEHQAELRSQREVHEEWIRETLVPNAYIAFSSLVANDNFANLAVVLIGVLSDVTSLVGTPKQIEKRQIKLAKRATTTSSINDPISLLGTSTIITGPDLGEVTERMYDSGDGTDFMDTEAANDFGTPIERPSSGGSAQRSSNRDVPQLQEKITIPKATSSSSNTSHTPLHVESSQAEQSSTPRNTPAAQSYDEPSERSRKSQTATLATHARIKASKSILSNEQMHARATDTLGDQETKSSKRKKKKGKNAIDDLFSGFG